ncbi:MAG: polyprenol monophosphomannose synthase [Nitrospirae bacterium]|nr:polyprenol monophosphomannose synthase [Nitrospirota bacterium]
MKTIVMIPTYNERENIEPLIKDIFNLGIEDISVLVVDDNSPDGTWEIAERISREDPRVYLLRRMKKRGRGYAGVDGLMYCIREGADYIAEMDGDFSHDPRYIKDMLREIESCDVVTASRFIKGGSDSDRGPFRNLVSRFASIYARVLLGVDVKDPSLGFRLFRRKVLEAIDLEEIISIGPSIVLEMLYKINLKGFKIKEVPVRFVDRKHGSTKLDFLALLETLLMVLRLRKMRKQGRIT